MITDAVILAIDKKIHELRLLIMDVGSDTKEHIKLTVGAISRLISESFSAPAWDVLIEEVHEHLLSVELAKSLQQGLEFQRRSK